MPTILTFVSGPMLKKEGGFLGIGGTTVFVYQYNPIFYFVEGCELRNFGVGKIAFTEHLEKSELERKIIDQVKSDANPGFDTTMRYFSSDEVDYKVEFVL